MTVDLLLLEIYVTRRVLDDLNQTGSKIELDQMQSTAWNLIVEHNRMAKFLFLMSVDYDWCSSIKFDVLNRTNQIE